MQTVNKSNKIVNGSRAASSESCTAGMYSVKDSLTMSADELINNIRDRMQHILKLKGKKRNGYPVTAGQKNESQGNKAAHVLYITMNDKMYKVE